MGSESEESSRRRSKHRRYSAEDDVAPSKRRKHRHRHGDDVAERKRDRRHVADSDLEEGEIIEDDHPILGIHGAHADVGGNSSSLPLENNGNDSEGKFVKNGKVLIAEDLTGRSQTCNEGLSQQNSRYGNGDIGLNENYCVTKESVSPIQSSRSHSSGRRRERSKSFEKVSPMRVSHKKDDDTRFKDGKKTNVSHDERMAIPNWDSSRHGYSKGSRDNNRGHSSSYRSRHRQVDSHQGREFMNNEQEWSRESKEKETITSSSRDSERRTDQKKFRERERERDKESDREKSRVRDRDRERERTREREERERRKDRELERGMESGRSRHSRDRESYRDMENGRQRSRERESYGDRESRRYRSRDRERERSGDGDENRVKKVNVNNSRRDEEEQEEYQERVALQLVDQEEDDLDRIKEESRRRRQAIIEKYKMQQQLHKPQRGVEDKDDLRQVPQEVVAISVAPETLLVRNEDDASTVTGDPSLIVHKSPPQIGVSISEKASRAGGLGEGTPKSETSGDMFCDDIFGDSPTGVRKTGKGDGLAPERGGLHDNWDDAEGYYSFRLGEVLDGRYEVAAAHGKGVFSTVVRAKDLKAGIGDPEEVAIKIIRNNEHMHKAGKEELVILKKLVGADPEDKRHCVRFLSSFKYRNHLCLVFESLNMNLREVLKKFGRNIGLKLTAVRLYSKQLFIALKHLRNCGVLHSDIKPDNMLVNEAKNVLKLCDFGNAMFAGKNEITPYLVSRFYRAPEIILGLAYDHPLDIWSVGCCIFELYCGKVLFPGATNNDMLRLHMELKGLFPKKMLRKGAFTEQHFDQDLNFLAIEEDPVTKKTVRRLITSIKPKDIGAIITGSPGEDPKMLANFKDLLEKIFILDPDKRLTVSQALSHPFITGK